ncbi:hypothetical protein BC829DRAFT_378142, partial [Chytridium lagenaria]
MRRHKRTREVSINLFQRFSTEKVNIHTHSFSKNLFLYRIERSHTSGSRLESIRCRMSKVGQRRRALYSIWL